MPKQRDIVLIPVPFTDLSSARRRPVIVVSNDDYNHKTDDVIVLAMTSNLTPKDYVLMITNDNLEVGRLNRPGQVRVDKIYTLNQRIIVKTFGRINRRTFGEIRVLLNKLTSPSYITDDPDKH